MPIYEYECEFCGKHTDELQKASDPPLVECPACGKSGLQRLLSAPAFQLKGSGWYVTDFRADKKDKSTEKSPASKEKTESNSNNTEKSEVKKDSTPEKKSD